MYRYYRYAKNASTSSALGIGVTAPCPFVDSAAAAFAYFAQSPRLSPLMYYAQNAPSKVSPAPV